MTKYNKENEIIKRKYYKWQKEANGKSASTIDNIRKAIDRFEKYTRYKSFKKFNSDQAIAFKNYFLGTRASRSKETLSKSTILSTTRCLKDFFKWLSREPGYKKIDVREVEYLNLTDKEVRIAKAQKIQHFPTLAQVRSVINAMPASTDIEHRNKAIIALTMLTGMRSRAIASLRLKHINIENSPPYVEQMPDEVKTKFSKKIITYFIPELTDFQLIVIDWVRSLRDVKLYGNNDPLFPRTKITQDQNNSFIADGLEPICWQSANQIRGIFKEAFHNANLNYFHPHSLRHTLTHIGMDRCKSPAEFKAWSLNFGHEHVLTTLTSYGDLDEYTQGEIMQSIGKQKNKPDYAKKVYEMLKQKELAK